MNKQNKDHHDCFGCSLCLLVCPVWHQTSDVSLSPKSSAIALKQQAMSHTLAKGALSCIMCGACNTVCPEEIDLLGMNIGLRQELNGHLSPPLNKHNIAPGKNKRIFIPGAALLNHDHLMHRICKLLGRSGPMDVFEDHYHEIAHAMEFGKNLNAELLAHYIQPLEDAKTIIVDDGLLFRSLKSWLPKIQVLSLGEELSKLAQANISHTDLYIINSRSYHADFDRLRPHYYSLQNETGCAMNLDLQRVAQPSLGQIKYRNSFNNILDSVKQTAHILEGKDIQRIVVESVEEMPDFMEFGSYPVLHIGELIA